jgi:hypothetical protein
MKKGDKKTDVIAVRVEPEVSAAIGLEAEREDRTIAAMTRILIKEALAARDAKKGKKKSG